VLPTMEGSMGHVCVCAQGPTLNVTR
jgi:hypothetical protein